MATAASHTLRVKVEQRADQQDDAQQHDHPPHGDRRARPRQDRGGQTGANPQAAAHRIQEGASPPPQEFGLIQVGNDVTRKHQGMQSAHFRGRRDRQIDAEDGQETQDHAERAGIEIRVAGQPVHGGRHQIEEQQAR